MVSKQFRLWPVAVFLLVCLVTASQGAIIISTPGSVVVTTAASVGPPPISSVYGGWTGVVLSSMSAGSSPYLYPALVPWGYINAPAVLHWGDLTVDNSGQSVWEGQIVSDTSSPFYGEKGTAFYVNAKFVGDGIHKFSPEDISYTVTSTDLAHSLNASGTLAGLVYGVGPLIGIDFGADRVRSYDDTVYDYGTPASLSGIKVDEILYSGVAVAYDATTVGLGYVENYVNEVGPFDLTVTYTVNDGTGTSSSSQTRTVVPEPATIGLLALGAITLIRRRRK